MRVIAGDVPVVIDHTGHGGSDTDRRRA